MPPQTILAYEKDYLYYYNKDQDLRHRVCNHAKDKNSGKYECPRYRRFSHDLATEYCAKVSMRLCDVSELLYEHNTRHCAAHQKFVWTTTKCKNIRADSSDPNNDDEGVGYTDNWDPNYYWAVKQYPSTTYSEPGDRLCLHKDAILPSEVTAILANKNVGTYTKNKLERNEVWLRTNTGTGKTWMFAGVSCCADTPHSPRYQIRYDDDNWSNEEFVWPPALRTAGGSGIRKGWTYSGGATSAEEGTMTLLYQTEFLFENTCTEAYNKCMGSKSASQQYLCDMENCKFVHGPFTHHTVGMNNVQFVRPLVCLLFASSYLFLSLSFLSSFFSYLFIRRYEKQLHSPVPFVAYV